MKPRNASNAARAFDHCLRGRPEGNGKTDLTIGGGKRATERGIVYELETMVIFLYIYIYI